MPPTIINVDVTPLMGGAVCEIDGTPGTHPRFVKGGVLKLPAPDAPFVINFRLPQIDPLQFDRANPIWCSPNCPNAVAADPQIRNPRVDATGKILTVDGIPAGPKNVLHYSLGFLGGGRFDPIIING